MDAASLYFLSRKLRALAQAKRPGSLSLAEAVVLATARASTKGTHVGEIVARHGMTQSLVSTAAMSLERKGLLRAHPDPSDRRRTLLVVTGVDAKRTTVDESDALAPALARLSSAERKAVSRGLAVLLRALSRATDRPSPRRARSSSSP